MSMLNLQMVAFWIIFQLVCCKVNEKTILQIDRIFIWFVVLFEYFFFFSKFFLMEGGGVNTFTCYLINLLIRCFGSCLDGLSWSMWIISSFDLLTIKYPSTHRDEMNARHPLRYNEQRQYVKSLLTLWWV